MRRGREDGGDDTEDDTSWIRQNCDKDIKILLPTCPPSNILLDAPRAVPHWQYRDIQHSDCSALPTPEGKGSWLSFHVQGLLST